MVAYSFKSLFGEQIRWGLKAQTLRAARAGRSRHARPGERLQLYVGLRTPRARRILDRDPPCVAVAPTRLRFEAPYSLVEVRVDGTELDPHDFAAADGFAWTTIRAKGAWLPDGKARWLEMPAEVMGCWWRYQHPAAFAAGTFEGSLIRWQRPLRVASIAHYAARYGPAIDPELYRIFAGQYLLRSAGPIEGTPPDLPDLGVS